MSSRHIPHPAFDNAANLDSTLLRAIRQYEQALMANDTATLSELFADNPDDIPVVRSDSAGMLVGHNAITAFRAKRGGAPTRKLHRRVARQLDANNACVISEFDKAAGGRVIQTQVWSRVADASNSRFDSRSTEPAWKIVAAHLTYPTPAVDPACLACGRHTAGKGECPRTVIRYERRSQGPLRHRRPTHRCRQS